MDYQPTLPPLNQSGKLKIISIILSCMLGVVLIPAIPLFFMAGVATFMSSYAMPNIIIMVVVSSVLPFVFWAVPIFMIVCIIAAHELRKNNKFIKSIVLQVIPLVMFFALIFVLVILI